MVWPASAPVHINHNFIGIGFDGELAAPVGVDCILLLPRCHSG